MTEIPINSPDDQIQNEINSAFQPQEQDGMQEVDQISGPIEGAPFEVANDEPQQQVEQVSEEAASEPDEPAPEDDTRWDHDKAETLATALKDSGIYDERMNQRKERIDYVNSDEFIENNTRKERENLEVAEDRVQNETPGTNRMDYWSGKRDETKNELDEAVTGARESGEKSLANQLENINEEFKNELTPYEELYDLNSDHFANMPTGEFMKIAEQYRGIGTELSNKEYYRDNSIKADENIKEIYARKESVNWRGAQEVADSMSGALSANSELHKEIRDKYMATIEDDFDKSPRQIMDAILDLDKEYLAQVNASIASTQKEKEDFLNQFRPKPQE